MTTPTEAIKTLKKILDDARANATTYNLADALEVQARHDALKLALAALKNQGTKYSIEEIKAWRRLSNGSVTLDDPDHGIAAWKAAQLEKQEERG